VTTLTRVY